MSDDDTRDLLGAYALDAVSDDERRAVEELVARDPDAARELADLRGAAADLATAAATTPPPALRARVLAAAASTPQEPVVAQESVAAEAPIAPVVPLASRRPHRTRWIAIAAAAVLGAAIPAGVAVHQSRELDAMRAEQAQVAAMLHDPTATMMHADVTGGGTATAVVTADAAMFTTQGVPDPTPGHVYQLWLVQDGKPVSAGTMAQGGSQSAMVHAALAPGDALAMTLEPEGGSAQPTTDPLVVLAS